MNLDKERYKIRFEKKCRHYKTSEIPDWYILDKITKKVIIGMNQLDLWYGGHQINRGYKYIIDNKLKDENKKLLCVVCNEIQLKGNNKIYRMFDKGFKDNTLCYLGNLENIINSFFNIS